MTCLEFFIPQDLSKHYLKPKEIVEVNFITRGRGKDLFKTANIMTSSSYINIVPKLSNVEVHIEEMRRTDQTGWLETFFSAFRKNIVGNQQTFESPFGKKKIVYADWTASGRAYGPIE
jgi:hypothetical protein